MVGALPLGRQSSHQRANQLTAAPAVERLWLPAKRALETPTAAARRDAAYASRGFYVPEAEPCIRRQAVSDRPALPIAFATVKAARKRTPLRRLKMHPLWVEGWSRDADRALARSMAGAGASRRSLARGRRAACTRACFVAAFVDVPLR